jgi:hypothetical protein
MARNAGSAARVELEDELDGRDQPPAAASWQREQALETWAKMNAGELNEVSRADIDAEFDAALAQLGSRRT